MEENNVAISLYELNKSIQLEIKSSFDKSYWVVGEINELKVNYTGHCYLELIEKDNISEAILAKARATIWTYNYRKLLPYFETTAQHAFCEGIKVMVRVTVEFHELYGLSLNIIDIDPAFTIGDLQQQKRDTITRLQNEGVFNMNREMPLPRVIQKIAVISSEKAAGYGDFINHLQKNELGIKFYIKLFPAFMQGEKAEESIIEALEQVYAFEDFFDVVVLIRGGGSKTDLSCFDKYWLAYHVAQFPLPVLSGIGHDQDDTVADMVANTKLKTPTAVASFILDLANDFNEYLNDLSSDFTTAINHRISDHQKQLLLIGSKLSSGVKLSLAGKAQKLENISITLKNTVSNYLYKVKKNRNRLAEKTQSITKSKMLLNYRSLNYYRNMLSSKLTNYIKNHRRKIYHSQELLSAYNPQNVLNRGYSITYHNGNVVKTNQNLKFGDEIETRLKKGNIKSTITK